MTTPTRTARRPVSFNISRRTRDFLRAHAAFLKNKSPYQNLRKEVRLADNILAQYKGLYIAPQAGQCNVLPEKNFLLLIIGDQKYQLIPESETTFFTNDRDLTFEFIKEENGEVLKFIVRENGRIVEEATKK